jgi:mevalonate kinase
MTIIAAKFDLIEYTKQLCKVGVSQEQANVQAQAMEKAIETAVAINKEELHPENLATKKDLLFVKQELKLVKQELKTDIALLRTELIKWILGTSASVGILSITAMAALLKIMIH